MTAMENPQAKLVRRQCRKNTLFDAKMSASAAKQSVAMLNPAEMIRNSVMFVTEVGAVLTTIAVVADLAGQGPWLYSAAVALILWATLLFANFAEALAEARGKAQAESLRRSRHSSPALRNGGNGEELVSSDELKEGDIVIVAAGETIPADGEGVAGAASVDESAITGESAPVIREAGGDRSGVTGGTPVLSDRIKVRVTAAAGNSFLDRMIALVEGAVRQKTPNEIALTATLAGLTFGFLLVTASLWPIGRYFGMELPIPTLIALLVCLIPTTIGALLAAIGIAGMDRVLSANIIAKSGKAVELAGDIDTLLLDKTGTITVGNRHAVDFKPMPGVALTRLAEAAVWASLGDQTPEGKSMLDFAAQGLGPELPQARPGDRVIEFSACGRLSGLVIPKRASYTAKAPPTRLSVSLAN